MESGWLILIQRNDLSVIDIIVAKDLFNLRIFNTFYVDFVNLIIFSLINHICCCMVIHLVAELLLRLSYLINL